MEIEEITKRIYQLMVPFITNDMPPIAYISLEAGYEFPFTNEELTESFNKLKWDTTLSSAELLILRKPKAPSEDVGLILGGFSLFNEELNGKIDEMGLVPTFCFVGKHVC